MKRGATEMIIGKNKITIGHSKGTVGTCCRDKAQDKEDSIEDRYDDLDWLETREHNFAWASSIYALSQIPLAKEDSEIREQNH